jgi:hypothetical protein
MTPLILVGAPVVSTLGVCAFYKAELNDLQTIMVLPVTLLSAFIATVAVVAWFRLVSRLASGLRLPVARLPRFLAGGFAVAAAAAAILAVPVLYSWLLEIDNQARKFGNYYTAISPSSIATFATCTGVGVLFATLGSVASTSASSLAVNRAIGLLLVGTWCSYAALLAGPFAGIGA